MRRFGMMIRLKPGSEERYKRYHAAVWPEVLGMIHECKIRNYSIYLKGGIPRGSVENRPTGVTSKPANGIAQDVILSILLSPDQASRFWFSSCAVRISGCGRGVAGDPAWR
jgi:L-rhamnose mutarotase